MRIWIQLASHCDRYHLADIELTPEVTIHWMGAHRLFGSKPKTNWVFQSDINWFIYIFFYQHCKCDRMSVHTEEREGG